MTPKTRPVQVRISFGAWERYSALAQAEAKTLSKYLRDRLERDDDLAFELTSIRRAIDRIETAGGAAGAASTAPANATKAGPSAVELETLLLLRALANPQKQQMVQGELARLGFSHWDGKLG